MKPFSPTRRWLAAQGAITIQMGPGEYKLLGTPIEAKRRPRSNVQAQFSSPWIVATTLLDGCLSLADFSPAAQDRPEVLALTAKIHTALDASLLAEGGGVGPTRLTVELRDGRRYIQTVRTAKGEPNQPLSVAEFEQKAQIVRDRRAWPKARWPRSCRPSWAWSV